MQGVAPIAATSATARERGARIAMDRVVHRYGPLTVVNDVSLDIESGELVALLGPSGCGKTTLLRIIAGFVRQTGGTISIGGNCVDRLAPNQRNTGIVFQNYALFPHMTVAENVGYGLAARGASRTSQRARVEEMLGLVQMSAMFDRFPKQLSGGQQQRVALARALAVAPQVLLLDESFAALDKNLRLDMQIEIKRIQRMSGITTILVTHDQEEAMSMADRIAVLNGGVLEQFGAPVEIYDRPRSLFVNTFVGAANVLPGTLTARDGETATVALESGDMVTGCLRHADLATKANVKVCIRPENLEVVSGDAPGLRGHVEMSFPLGSTVVHDVRLSDGTAIKISEMRQSGATTRAPGTEVRIRPSRAETVAIFKN
jgi:putative spermidine/putrescine transport system ATP-binding protein